jgi:hypothetical protein
MTYPHVEYLGPAYPDRSTHHQETTRELDTRTSDGIHVRLLWRPCDGHISVAVNDTKTGEAFELPVRDGQQPLDVFQHPYAYAATCRDGTIELASGARRISLAAHPTQ